MEKRLTKLRLQIGPDDVQRWLNECLFWAAGAGPVKACLYLHEEGADPTWRQPFPGGYVINRKILYKTALEY